MDLAQCRRPVEGELEFALLIFTEVFGVAGEPAGDLADRGRRELADRGRVEQFAPPGVYLR